MLPPITDLLKVAQTAVRTNSPAILTGVGIAGTVTTAALTGRAAFRLGKRHEYYVNSRFEDERGVKELLKEDWKEFVPPVLSGVSTVVAIFGVNHIHNRRGAAITAAYTLTERAYSEYREKVQETFGENKERKVRDEIAQDRVNADPVSTREVIITGNGDVLCYETMTGRYFKSNVEALRKVQNDINQEIVTQMYASQNDYFEAIGLSRVSQGDDIGWNVAAMLEMQFSAVLSENSEPCICVGYTFLPTTDYYKIG